ncbi:MAG: citrate/2-methylcitrate synthase [Promethearchaeota archaeon]
MTEIKKIDFENVIYNPGLRSIKVGDTSLVPLSEKNRGLTYCGYHIDDLGLNSTFEETSYLIVNGELPNREQLAEWTQKLINSRSLPKMVKLILNQIPQDTHPMDVLRTAVSVLGVEEPEQNDDHKTVGIRLLGVLPTIIAYWYLKSRGKEIRLDSKEEAVGGYFLDILKQKRPTDTERNMMNCSLIMYAEHELAASTFATRVCISTLSDFHSAICSGIGTLKGPLNGGANEAAMRLLSSFSDPSDAEKGIRRMLQQKELVMGFGHAYYATGDPRSPHMKKWARKLSEERNDMNLFNIAETIENVMREEKGLHPNLDYYTAVAYAMTDIPRELATPVFTMSRSSGWIAHIAEQRVGNKLIRPIAKYVGHDEREYVPLDKR